MQFLLDFINVPVPAVSIITRVNLALELNFISNSIDNLLLFIRGVELSDFTWSQQVIDIDQESLISNLTLCEKEENIFFLDSCLLIEGL